MRSLGAILLLTLAAAGTARAQATQGEPRPTGGSEDPKVFLTINGGLQPGTSDFSDNVVFIDSGGAYTDMLSGAAAREQASFDGSYRVEAGTLFDVSGGVHVWRNLGLGVGVSRYSLDAAVSLSAQVPHPFFFDRIRSVTGDSAPLTHEETAVHFQASVVLPAGGFTVTAFGGPTYFTVKQDLVTDVRLTHSYPYDTVAFAATSTRQQTGSKLGFNVGADAAYFFSNHVGVGWLTRYSGATIGLASVDDGTVRVRVGGLYTAGGLRLRF